MSDEAAAIRVLIVDDDPQLLRGLQGLLRRQGFEVHAVAGGAQVLAQARAFDPDVVLLDLMMPDPDGMAVLEVLRDQAPEHQVIMFTAAGTTDRVIEAIKRGAFWFLDKQCDHRTLVQIIQRAAERRRLHSRIAGLEQPPLLVGNSGPMCQLRQTIAQLADDPVTVLITGESGTGKEMAAREIHRLSSRSRFPFAALNCGSIPATLIERELLGHERGAFTDARERKAGLFEQGDRGTVLLDEVGTLPPGAQVALLRVLQERTVRRLGSTKEQPVDVRVISASNQPLADLVQEGAFRADLLYRLDVFHLHVPPLRERAEDVPLLAAHFLRKNLGKAGRRTKVIESFSPAAMDLLQRYAWPGNVRELENCVERAVVVCDGPEIVPRHLPAAMREGEGVEQPAEAGSSYDGNDGRGGLSGDELGLLDWEAFRTTYLSSEHRRWLEALLERFAGNKARAAREGARMDRANFRKLMRKFEME